MVGYMDTRQEELKVEPTLYDVIEAVQGGFIQLEAKMDARFDQVDAQFRVVNQRLFKLELTLEDHSDTILNHEERLGTLESWKNGVGGRRLAGA